MIRRDPDAFALLTLGLALWIGLPAAPRDPVARAQFRFMPALYAATIGAEESFDQWLARFEQRRDRVWQRLDRRMREFEERLAEIERRQRFHVSTRVPS